MTNLPLGRPSIIRLAYALIPLLAACSGNSGGGASDSGYNEALRAYEESVAQRTAEVAGAIAAAYLEELSSGVSDADAIAKRFQNEITGLSGSLCDQIKALGGKAGSGDTKTRRLDEARVTSEELVRDGFVRALLEKILAASPEQREQLLLTLGVKASGASAAEVQGTAALQEVGLFDGQNQISIPQRGTDQYVRYERWLSSQAPGFAGITSKLMGNAKAEIDRCSSSA